MGMINFLIKKYAARQKILVDIEIADYRKDLPSIGIAFQTLLSQENIDQNGYCIEWYINENDVNCLVRIADII